MATNTPYSHVKIVKTFSGYITAISSYFLNDLQPSVSFFLAFIIL